MTTPVLTCDAVVVAASDCRLAWRAAESFVAVGAVTLVLRPWWAGLLAFSVFLAAGCVRVLLWRHTLGKRRLVATSEHLVAVHGGRPRRWIDWDDLTGLRVSPADRLPGWWHGSMSLTVSAVPDVRVQPESAFVGPLVELMVSRRNTSDVRARLKAACEPHGVAVE